MFGAFIPTDERDEEYYSRFALLDDALECAVDMLTEALRSLAPWPTRDQVKLIKENIDAVVGVYEDLEHTLREYERGEEYGE